MRIRKILLFTFAAVLIAAVVPGAHAADAFPTKPIQLVIPFAPGDTDQMLRPFSDRMGEFLGHPVVMNYKPGAAGSVGSGFVAASNPDGYTIVGSSPSSLVVVPLTNKEIKYNLDSFQPVAGLSAGAFLIVVQAASPYKNLKDLVEHAKKAPGTVTFSTSGPMSLPQLLAEIFSQKAGIKLMHIPYQGSGPAVTAVLSGNVDMASTAIAPAMAQIKAGTLRALAVINNKRLKAFPDVPTLTEEGYNIDADLSISYGILAPKGTPREIVGALSNAAHKVIEKYGDQVGQTLSLVGAEVRFLGPDEYGAYLKNQEQLFSAAIKNLNN